MEPRKSSFNFLLVEARVIRWIEIYPGPARPSISTRTCVHATGCVDACMHVLSRPRADTINHWRWLSVFQSQVTHHKPSSQPLRKLYCISVWMTILMEYFGLLWYNIWKAAAGGYLLCFSSVSSIQFLRQLGSWGRFDHQLTHPSSFLISSLFFFNWKLGVSCRSHAAVAIARNLHADDTCGPLA